MSRNAFQAAFFVLSAAVARPFAPGTILGVEFWFELSPCLLYSDSRLLHRAAEVLGLQICEKGRSDLSVFLNPKSVAVIGATERAGSWGSVIMEALLSRPYSGRIYPVNRRAQRVYGIASFGNVGEIPGNVDLAIIITPEQSVEETVRACGRKQVRGVAIVTAGFGEVSPEGADNEKHLAEIGRSLGLRILGPNVSGVFNLHAHFNAAGSTIHHMLPSPLAAVSQGGYAFHDLVAGAYYRGMGVGQFIHTGNECDLTASDFLEYFGEEPDVKGIVMYIETVRDAGRFLPITRRIAGAKPVVVYKGGQTANSARAAASHTGALSGTKEVYEGVLRQLGLVISPTMELLFPLGHALIERPPMRGRRVAIVTMGGSWGVALSDSLESEGLRVPEFGSSLQNKLRALGLPGRASTRNPVDIGASGLFRDKGLVVEIGREILLSGETDALILHGIGRPGRDVPGDRVEGDSSFVEVQENILMAYAELEKESHRPVFIGTHYTPWESQAISEVNRMGVRTYHRLGDIAKVLSCLREYWHRRQEG
jgi:acetyltransferase